LEALSSCLQQTYRPIEILIGDDSKGDETEKAMASYISAQSIHYFHNKPSLGQGSNVNSLIQKAQGVYLILLHDDDMLFPNSVEQLYNTLIRQGAEAVFGKQMVIDIHGQELFKETEELNRNFSRTPDKEGPQLPIESALLAQFPNNGYLVETKLAQKVGYRSGPEVGNACDYDFGLRLALLSSSFFFINTYTAKSRITPHSVIRTDDYSHITYSLIENMHVPSSFMALKTKLLSTYAVAATGRLIELEAIKEARGIFYSPQYPNSNKIKRLIFNVLLSLPPNLASRIWKSTVLVKKRIFRL
jgi:glycosyltransferase involved in cell wall biosynthesis